MQSGEGTVSFVARIWLEHRSNGSSDWRGHIQHVQSGEERYFRKLAEIRVFIEQLTEVSCDALWSGDVEDTESTR